MLMKDSCGHCYIFIFTGYNWTGTDFVGFADLDQRLFGVGDAGPHVAEDPEEHTGTLAGGQPGLWDTQRHDVLLVPPE